MRYEKAVADKANRNADALVRKALVAFYSLRKDSLHSVDHIGTGFLIENHGRPALVTAKHTLYGRDGSEAPFLKAVVLNRLLRGLFQLPSGIITVDDDNDLCSLFADSYPMERCLPQSSLSAEDTSSAAITLYGFTSRGLEQDIDARAPELTPFILHEMRAPEGRPGYTTVKISVVKPANRSSAPAITVPDLAGMSGSPMLDTGHLLEGIATVVGVLTDHVRQTNSAVGESSPKVIALLANMQD